MQKIDISVLEKMMEQKLTGKEVDFLLYIARYQNDAGEVCGVYYRDVCEALHLSHQAFYNCKKSLEEKGIIKCKKANYYDWDITILDNDFRGKFENKGKYGRGYVSLYCNMVRDEKFRGLKAGARLMALYLLREWRICRKKSGRYSYRISRRKFLEKFAVLFGVGERMVRYYLGQLADYLTVYLKEGMYYITFKIGAVEEPSVRGSQADEYRGQVIAAACRRNRIRQGDISDENIRDLHGLMRQYDRKISDLQIDMSGIIYKSILVLNMNRKSKYQWKRRIQAALVHKILREEIDAAMGRQAPGRS